MTLSPPSLPDQRPEGDMTITDERTEHPPNPIITGRPVRVPGELPILPAWAKSWALFIDTAAKAARRLRRRIAWHGVRLPLYALRLAGYSPRGLARVLAALWSVFTDGEARPLRLDAVDRRESKEWLSLRKERNDRVRRRLIVAGTLLGLLAVALLVLALLVRFDVIALPPAWVGWTVLFAVVELLGYVGRPIGKPLVKPATMPAGVVEPLRAPVVMTALTKLGIGGMSPRDIEEIRLLFDVARVARGYRVDMELPAGVEASAVMEKRSRLSAALRRELGCVWPSVGARHEGHLSLFVADEPMAKAKQDPWPLRRDGGVNVFRAVHEFTDQEGAWVDLTLAYTSGIVGAVPRMGKTFGLRQLALTAALDVRTRLYVYDLKGTGDLSPLAPVAHAYGVGDEPEDIAAQLADMRALREEMRARAKRIRGLPREECPENKVTDVLASRRDVGLEPVFVAVDECQVWFEDQPTAVREEFIAIVTDLVKRGPALGIMCYVATQKPDAKSIPTGISANASIRLCFKVNDWQSNDQVLGTGAHGQGLKATLFAFEDKGVAYFKGEGARPQIVRTVAGLDAVAAEKVARRARAMREAANRITGYAAGEEIAREVEQIDLVEDVRAVVADAPAMHSADIVAGLTALRPGAYGSLDAETLGRQLRAAGVKVGQVHVSGKPRAEASRKGVKREALEVLTTAAIGPDAEEAAAVELDNVHPIRRATGGP